LVRLVWLVWLVQLMRCGWWLVRLVGLVRQVRLARLVPGKRNTHFRGSMAFAANCVLRPVLEHHHVDGEQSPHSCVIRRLAVGLGPWRSSHALRKGFASREHADGAAENQADAPAALAWGLRAELSLRCSRQLCDMPRCRTQRCGKMRRSGRGRASGASGATEWSRYARRARYAELPHGRARPEATEWSRYARWARYAELPHGRARPEATEWSTRCCRRRRRDPLL
jgi:hypothetical protein